MRCARHRVRLSKLGKRSRCKDSNKVLVSHNSHLLKIIYPMAWYLTRLQGALQDMRMVVMKLAITI